MAIDIRKIGDVMDEYFEKRSIYKCWSGKIGKGGYVWVRKEDVNFIEFASFEEQTPENHRVLVALPMVHLKEAIGGEQELVVIGAIHYVQEKKDLEKSFQEYVQQTENKSPIGFSGS